MFSKANDVCKNDKDIMINENKSFDWALTNAGDYALEYTLWVYLDRLPNTKVTRTARKYLMGTMFKVNEAVFNASVIAGVDLSTPDLVTAQVTQAAHP